MKVSYFLEIPIFFKRFKLNSPESFQSQLNLFYTTCQNIIAELFTQVCKSADLILCSCCFSETQLSERLCFFSLQLLFPRCKRMRPSFLLSSEKSHSLLSSKHLFCFCCLLTTSQNGFLSSHFTRIKVCWSSLNGPLVGYLFPL